MTSLQDHVNRRVIILQYTCAPCTETLTFYNRCSLLLHARQHFKNDGGYINLKRIQTSPLPISLAGFLPHPNIPIIYEKEDPTVMANIYINAQFYSPDPSGRGKDMIILKPSDLIFRQNGEMLGLKQVCVNVPKCLFITMEEHKILKRKPEDSNNLSNDYVTSENDIQIKEEDNDEYSEQTITMPVISKVESLQEAVKCFDCGRYLYCPLAEHYRGCNKPTNNALACTRCKMITSTGCSLKAHLRIHTKEPPHICPDCGENFELWLPFKKHLEEVCFHLQKLIRFRCPGKRCGKLFAAATTFAIHFKNHLNKVYSCSECNGFFVDQETVTSHMLVHNKKCYFTLLYDCSMCSNTEVLTEAKFEKHIEFHLASNARSLYIYICKGCKSYFRSTTTYAAHLLKCHHKKKMMDMPGKGSRYITKECKNCHNKIIFNVEKPITYCSKCMCEAKADTKLYRKSKKYFCIMCNLRIQVEDKSLHLKNCKYADAVVEIPRIKDDHSALSDALKYYSSSSDASYVSDKSPIKRSCSTEEVVKKKKKRIYIPNYRNKKPEVQLDLTAEEPVPFDGTYLCKVCEYSHTIREEFHKHIKEHRDISTAYQCMECGECFVVKPSLHKHLMHFHNISDYETYVKNNDCFDAEAVKELEEIMNLAPGESKSPVKENQCRVCLEEFEDPVVMNKHYRVHGMAFILKNSK